MISPKVTVTFLIEDYLGLLRSQAKTKGRAPLISAPAPMCKSSGLEGKLQAELNETWVADRAGDLAEIPIVR